MRKVLAFLVLPTETSDFELAYLARVNRIALLFFALHVPVFALIGWLNGTGAGLATALTLAVLVGPVIAHFWVDNPRAQSVIFGITAMCMGGVLVHLGQGPLQIEMHFYFFALLAMCAVFGNPLVILAAAVTVAVHHLLVWLVLPSSVFNYDAAWWVVAVHAGFVVLESVASTFIARSFFDNVIGLEKIVQARTGELDARNRDMRVLLDNVQQGFLTIDRGGALASERSAAIDAWFGAPSAQASWFDYLAGVSAHFADRSRLAWEEVVADVMPLELTLDQMPRQLTFKGAHYHFDYRPIGSGEPYSNYLVIVSDVTTELLREHAELERRETMALFERLLADRTGFRSFFDEATDMVDLVTEMRTSDASVVKRAIHTLKGNAALYGLASVAKHCEELEDLIAERGSLPTAEECALLRQRWTTLSSDIEVLLGTRTHSIEIDDAQYEALLAATCAGEPARLLVERVRGLKLEPTAKRLAHFQEQAKRIAERLGKGDTVVTVEDHGLRLDPRRWAGFWSAFVHALRNAVDHGIEPTVDRIATGKEEPARITLRARKDDQRLEVEIADNGRGIDWELVGKRAASAGLPTGSALDLEHALFVDGISTAARVSDISGRGAGMGALLAATHRLGGSIYIESKLNVGTTVRFSFPHSAAHEEAPMPMPLAAAV